MVTIKGTKRESARDVKLIGRKYKDGSHWGEWWSKGLFDILEKLPNVSSLNDNGYIGLMQSGEDGFEYWIGMFFESGTDAPEGFEELYIESAEFEVFYLCGSEESGELFGDVPHRLCVSRLFEEQLSEKKGGIRFERYNCPRYTTPDENGKVILDYAIELE